MTRCKYKLLIFNNFTFDGTMPRMNPENPVVTATSPPAAVKPSALMPALAALLLPLLAFALSWMIAGKIPMAVAKAEWGTWFMMGALLGVAGVAGLVFVSGRSCAAAIAAWPLPPAC